MKNLIEALQIFLKYEDAERPTHCEQHEMWITEVDKADVSQEDMKRLDELGFFWDDSSEGFKSFKFGSA